MHCTCATLACLCCPRSHASVPRFPTCSHTAWESVAGHSLGGAVALLCTLRLLQGLPRGDPSLYCICFGTPAIGNAALAALVAEYGWESHILNFVLPGQALL